MKVDAVPDAQFPHSKEQEDRDKRGNKQKKQIVVANIILKAIGCSSPASGLPLSIGAADVALHFLNRKRRNHK
jgi:hypothetical protein